MSRQRYEIAIVGGGIAGLTLALICERLNFSYVLFERRNFVEADAGAGLGIQPNSLCILDQLGIADRLQAEAGAGVITDFFRFDGQGNLTMTNRVFATLRERVGYDFTFMARAKLHRLLWESVKRKECLKAPCLVTSVEEKEDEVVVHTENGLSYTADLVVGADGVNSYVRKLIDASTAVNDCMAISFTATYGISSPTQGIPPGTTSAVHRQNESVLLFTNKVGAVFWFIIEHYMPPGGSSQPSRYTAADAEKACEAVAHIKIMPDTTFGDVYKNASVKLKIPLQEGISTSWHTHRSVLVGDAACKMSPTGGMGAGHAIEMSAALMNELARARRSSEAIGRKGISAESLHAALQRYHESREPAVAAMLERSNLITEILLCVPGPSAAMFEQVKHIPDEVFFTETLRNWHGSTIIEDLEVTPRGKFYKAVMKEMEKETTQAANPRRGQSKL